MKRSLLLFAVTCLLMSNAVAQSGWNLQTNPLGEADTTEIGKVQFVSLSEGWISVGTGGGLLHTTDAGENWTIVTPFPDDTVWCPSDAALAMSWVGQTHGWKINSVGPVFGTSYGVVIHQTTDGGATWQKKVLSTTNGDMGVQIQFVDINNGWLMYFNVSTMTATFLKTTNGGNNWVPFTGAGIFYFADANNGWSFYGSGINGAEPPFKILRTINGGADWIEQFSDNVAGRYNAIFFSDINNGWIVGDNGKVVKTTNGGGDWNYVTNSGINPAERSKTVFFLGANNGWISSKDGAGNGTIQHTTDGGASWVTQTTPLNNPQGGNSIYSIYFVDAQNGWLTASGKQVCRYTGPTSVGPDHEFVNTFSLCQNYPNPFNPATNFQFSIVSCQLTILKVYDVLGREVATLLDEVKQPGMYTVRWDAGGLPSGVYYYRLQSGEFVDVKRMLLVK